MEDRRCDDDAAAKCGAATAAPRHCDGDDAGDDADAATGRDGRRRRHRRGGVESGTRA